MPVDTILELRTKIDAINLQILELLNERARIASDIGKVQIRGEYELYDPSDTEVSMLSMLSLGVVYRFK